MPPSSSIARFAMTSFAFMLDCVPLPVCQITSGKWSDSLPSATSPAAFFLGGGVRDGGESSVGWVFIGGETARTAGNTNMQQTATTTHNYGTQLHN